MRWLMYGCTRWGLRIIGKIVNEPKHVINLAIPVDNTENNEWYRQTVSKNSEADARNLG